MKRSAVSNFRLSTSGLLLTGLDEMEVSVKKEIFTRSYKYKTWVVRRRGKIEASIIFAKPVNLDFVLDYRVAAK